MQPKERIPSLGYQILSAKACTSLSYRNATEMLNLFFHRNEQNSIKLRTLSDMMERTGEKISESLAEATKGSLKAHGFDEESGLPETGKELSKNITGSCVSEKTAAHIQTLQGVIDSINTNRDEKIPFAAGELDIEVEAMDCVYVSIDDIGVKRQKGSRSPEFEKDTKYVENTVAHIQYGQENYVLTAVGMKTVMKSILAFLLANGLLKHRLIFLTDGARNIKSSIKEFFSFRPDSIILDWFHLKKKCQELLSMAIRGRIERNRVLEKLLRVLWAGDVNSAISYLNTLEPSIIKNRKWLEGQCSYLERKKDNLACYAVRAKLGLRNSSNSVEKENDLLVAKRQKHNGMSWTDHGSGSLAALEMVFQNGYEKMWFSEGQISFALCRKVAESLDSCA